MAPRRKKTASAQAREFKLRLPEDLSERIIAKAKEKGWPQNRVIINELADIPDLERYRNLANLVEEMRNVLARYGARIVMHDLSGELLTALDAALAAQGTAQQAALDKCRVLRTAMLKTHKQGDERK
jgi:hypothetical protein